MLFILSQPHLRRESKGPLRWRHGPGRTRRLAAPGRNVGEVCANGGGHAHLLRHTAFTLPPGKGKPAGSPLPNYCAGGRVPIRFAFASLRILDVSAPSDPPLTRRPEIGYAQLDFIKTDLEVCFTLAIVAETAFSMGHREHAERTLATAEKGYSDMLRIVSQARMADDVEKDLQAKLKQLRERLDALGRIRHA